MAKSVKIEIARNGAQKIATALLAAKKAEAQAKQERIELEDKLLNHPSIKKGLKPEGTVNFQVKDGDAIKIVGKLYRSVDQDAVKSDKWTDLPVEIRETCFRWKADLQLTAVKALDASNPKMANKVHKFFSTTPGRAAITITQK